MMMKTMALLWLLVVLLTVTSASSSSSVFYGIVPREDRAHRVLEDGVSESPELVSFDGDLDAIAELALAKAELATVAPGGGEDPFSCGSDAGDTSHLDVLTWTYSIETVPGATVELVYGEVAEITLEQTAPLSLACRNEEVAYANIVAMDANNIASSVSEGALLTSCLLLQYFCLRLRLFLWSSLVLLTKLLTNNSCLSLLKLFLYIYNPQKPVRPN